MKRFPSLTFLFAALAVAVHASPGLTEMLQFERSAFSRAEIWRLFTGHFTHFGAQHLLWDAIVFVAFGTVVELRSRRGFLICISTSALVISLCVLVLQPQFAFYRGLSGLDSALFGFVTADLLHSGLRRRDGGMIGIGSLALIGFIGKSIFEISTGSSLWVKPEAVFENVPLAHLAGAIVGAVVALTLPPKPESLTDSAHA